MSEKNKQVTKEEFNSFLDSYPVGLNVDKAMMFEPPIKSYNDFYSGLIWPESIVAYIKLRSETSLGGQDEYYIVKK